VQREQEKLLELYKEKARLIDVIMETETFKVARELLEKYAPEQLRKLTKEDVRFPESSTPHDHGQSPSACCEICRQQV
jgi:hypothetical protein